MTETITITKKEYVELLKADKELTLLHIGGVDNWEFYGDSLNPDDGKSYEDHCEEIDKNHLS